MKTQKKDNTTLKDKVLLRHAMLRARDDDPVVLETHGGWGQVWAACYFHLHNGIVFETDERKVNALARMRPSWAVYQNDCISAILDGALCGRRIDVLDCDPYGEVWPIIAAFFTTSNIERPPRLDVVVNDGARMKIQRNGGWDVETLAPVVRKYGASNLFRQYKEASRDLLEIHAARANYTVTSWFAQYTGHARQMTHWHAVLNLKPVIAESPAAAPPEPKKRRRMAA